jgi:hypothetical protein
MIVGYPCLDLRGASGSWSFTLAILTKSIF